MGFRFFKVQTNRKRKDAIAELMAMGYDQNEANEILDIQDINYINPPKYEADPYEGANEMET